MKGYRARHGQLKQTGKDYIGPTHTTMYKALGEAHTLSLSLPEVPINVWSYGNAEHFLGGKVIVVFLNGKSIKNARS